MERIKFEDECNNAINLINSTVKMEEMDGETKWTQTLKTAINALQIVSRIPDALQQLKQLEELQRDSAKNEYENAYSKETYMHGADMLETAQNIITNTLELKMEMEK